MTQDLPVRKEVPTELTWDLTRIYKDDATWEADFKSVTAAIAELPKLAGKLGEGADALLNVLQTTLDAQRRLEKLYVYASMRSDQDTADGHYQAMYARISKLATTYEENTAFVQPELLAVPADTLTAWLSASTKLAEYKRTIAVMTRDRGHVLDAKSEALVSAAGDALGASADTFGVLNNSDIDFGMVQDDEGNWIKLSHGIYSQLIDSTNRDVRKNAFETLYQSYDGLRHTFAATLAGNTKAQNFNARAHKYPSARAAAMAHNEIPEQVFDTLIERVNANLPLLHRYVALRKKVLGLKELHSYDLYTPITGEATLTYTIDEAKAEGEKALAVLGEDYGTHVKHIFNDRLIDFIENKNKRSGAYSGGSYDTEPYILHNWHDSLDALYTLVHETGHSVHSWYTRHNNPYQTGEYPIFTAEIASTTNEALLTDYLLKTQDDPKTRAFILNYYLDGFKGTMFRQTQFAEFEHWIHQEDQAGQPLTADFLSDKYAEINDKYYGPALEQDPEISLEWARIPHFYYNYYVYQYATGFAAANALSSHIATGDTEARDKYLGFLKSGGSTDPITTMKRAGVDMTDGQYLDDAFAVFEERLNELEKLLDQIK